MTSAITEMRRLRLRRRRRAEGRFESFYRVYIVVFFATLFGAFAHAAVAGLPVGPLNVTELNAFAIGLGLFTSLLIVNGIRTGRLGGPVMISRPDVHHVLLAPVDRNDALRPDATGSVCEPSAWVSDSAWGRFELLLLDEPLASLDQGARKALLELVAGLRDQGATTILASHDPDVLEIATRCIALRDGRVVWDGPPSDDMERLMA